MSEPGGSNPGSAPGNHEFGANEAKAYVAPQTVKMKAKPSDTGPAKVEINAGAKSGTAPSKPVPEEVYTHQAATPFEAGAAPPAPAGRPQPPDPIASTGLPFQSGPTPPAAVQPPGPVAAPAPVAASAPAAAPAAPVPAGPTPKHPPAQLASPGVLSGSSGAPPLVRASLQEAAAPAPAGPAEGYAAAPAAAPAPSEGYAPAPAAHGYPPAPTPAAAEGYPPAPSVDAGPTGTPDAPAAEAKEEVEAPGPDNPLAATNSPWSNTSSVAQDLLPSANMLAQPQPEDAPAPPPPPETPQRSSRGMVVGLAILAVCLLGAIIYFVVFEQEKADGDPAEIKAGTEQKEYEDEPVPSAKPEPKPKPKPKPVYRPKPKPKPKPTDDIYDGLE